MSRSCAYERGHDHEPGLCQERGGARQQHPPPSQFSSANMHWSLLCASPGVPETEPTRPWPPELMASGDHTASLAQVHSSFDMSVYWVGGGVV